MGELMDLLDKAGQACSDLYYAIDDAGKAGGDEPAALAEELRPLVDGVLDSLSEDGDIYDLIQELEGGE